MRNRSPTCGRRAKAKKKRLLNKLASRRDLRQSDAALQLSHDWLLPFAQAKGKENPAFHGTRGAAGPVGLGRAGRVREHVRA
jgi:hypothetical protein